VSCAVFQARLKHELQQTAVLNDLAQSLGLQGNLLGELSTLTVAAQADKASAKALDEAYVSSLRVVWITIAALAGAALLASLAIPSQSLIKEESDYDEDMKAVVSRVEDVRG
jgi:hypothetical protein